MNQFVMLLFFVGIIMIMHGIYQQKLKQAQDNVKIEYRFIPRTYYEEQLANTNMSSQFKNMFNDSEPWLERNVTLPSSSKSQPSSK